MTERADAKAHSELSQLISALEALRVSGARLLESWSELQALDLSRCEIEPLIAQLITKTKIAQEKQRPLRLMFFGGTGVGKSSMLNTLAGRELSSVSHLERAHTSSFTLYLHEKWRLLIERASISDDHGQVRFWPQTDDLPSAYVFHEIDELLPLCLIDAPDLDSIMTLHRKRVLKALECIDVTLWVSSPQKYRDQSCLEALCMIDRRRSVIALLNQIDLVNPSDWRELYDDACALSGELGFVDLTWYLSSTTIQNLKGEETTVITGSSDQVPSLMMNDLYLQLVRRFDQKETERILSLGLGLQLLKASLDLEEPSRIAERIDLTHEWFERSKEVLTPLAIDYARVLIFADHTSQLRKESRTNRETLPVKKLIYDCFGKVSHRLWWLIESIYKDHHSKEHVSSLNESKLSLRSAELRCLNLAKSLLGEGVNPPSKLEFSDRLTELVLDFSAQQLIACKKDEDQNARRLLSLSGLVLLIYCLLMIVTQPKGESFVSIMSTGSVMTCCLTLLIGRVVYQQHLMTALHIKENVFTLFKRSDLLDKALKTWLDSKYMSDSIRLSPRQQLALKTYQSHLNKVKKLGTAFSNKAHDQACQ